MPLSFAHALGMGSLELAKAGDCDRAIDLSRRCIELCEAQSLTYWKGWAMTGEGLALLAKGQPAFAEAMLAQAIAHFVAGGVRVIGRQRGWRSIALAQLGRFDEARREADLGREQALSSGQQFPLPLLAYARGMAERLDPNGSGAEEWFGISLGEARKRGMRVDELTAATALAQLLLQRGEIEKARELLAPIYDGFTEGFDAPQLKEAKTLLDEIDNSC